MKPIQTGSAQVERGLRSGLDLSADGISELSLLFWGEIVESISDFLLNSFEDLTITVWLLSQSVAIIFLALSLCALCLGHLSQFTDLIVGKFFASLLHKFLGLFDLLLLVTFRFIWG